MKRLTKYSLPEPTNVKDPRTDGYSVVVHPCQGINLFMTDPINVFEKASKDDEWEVKAFSDFFYLDAVSEGPGKKEYRFVQYYDMTPWTDVSSVYLGDIEITLNSKTVESQSFSLCVVARRQGRKPCRIITAVNPTVNRLKMDLDDILEVVCTRDDPQQSGEEVWCSLYDLGRSGVGNGSQWFERLRQEVLVLPETSPLPRDRDSLYFTVARSVAKLRRNPGLPEDRNVPPTEDREVQRQHHFWFRVRPEDKAAVLKANTGQPMANIVFNGTTGVCSNLQVLISTRGTRGEPVVPEYDKDRYEGHFRGLVGRYYTPSGGLLVNPSKTEGTVEILPDQNGVMVELAPPQMTWPYTDPKYRWMCEVEPVVTDVTPALPGFVGGKAPQKRLTCTELIDRTINHQPVQRFFIKPQCEIPAGEDMLFLGVVGFVCKEPSVISRRSVNCWLVKERTTKDEQDVLTHDRYKDLTPLPSVKADRKPRHTSHRQELALVPVRSYTPSTYTPTKYDKVVVKITEDRGDGLAVPGCVVTPFQSVKIEKCDKKNTCTVIYPASQEDYDRYAGTSSHHQQKKKESSPSSPNGKSPGSSLSPPPLPKFSGGSGGVGRDGGSGDVVRVVDPDEHSLVPIKPGQKIVVALPVQHWDMKNDLDFFWIINMVQLKQHSLFISDQRMVRDGRLLYQEVTITILLRNVAKEVGKFILGGLVCRNRHETRNVSVQLVIEDIYFPDSNPDYTKALHSLMKSVGVARKALAHKEAKEKAKQAPEPAADHWLLNGVKNPAERPAGICIRVRDPKSGHSCVMGKDDTLTIILPPSGTEPWALKGLPPWMDVKQTVENEGGKSFVFVTDGVTRFPQPEEIHLQSGKDIRVIRVQCQCDDDILAGLGS